MKKITNYKLVEAVKNPDTKNWLVSRLSIFGTHATYYTATKKDATELMVLIKNHIIKKFNEADKVSQSKALSLLNNYDYSKSSHLNKNCDFFYI